jgi:predicted secreted protein
MHLVPAVRHGRRGLSIIAAIALTVVIVTSSKVDAQPPTACPISDDTPIGVHVGEQFVIGVEYVVTGALWYLDEVSPEGSVRVVDERYVTYESMTPTATPEPTPTPLPPDPETGWVIQPLRPGGFRPVLVGGGGIDCWTFEATASGVTTLTLRFRRSFGPESDAWERQFRVFISPLGAPIQIPRARAPE